MTLIAFGVYTMQAFSNKKRKLLAALDLKNRDEVLQFLRGMREWFAKVAPNPAAASYLLALLERASEPLDKSPDEFAATSQLLHETVFFESLLPPESRREIFLRLITVWQGAAKKKDVRKKWQPLFETAPMADYFLGYALTQQSSAYSE